MFYWISLIFSFALGAIIPLEKNDGRDAANILSVNIRIPTTEKSSAGSFDAFVFYFLEDDVIDQTRFLILAEEFCIENNLYVHPDNNMCSVRLFHLVSLLCY